MMIVEMESFEKTTEKLGFISVNLELERGLSVCFGVGLVGGDQEEQRKAASKKELILFLPRDFSTRFK